MTNTFEPYATASALHARSQSQPLSSLQPPIIHASTVQPKRARAPSDPFLDTPALSRSIGAPSSHISATNTTALLSKSSPDGGEEPSSPITAFGFEPVVHSQVEATYDSDEVSMRIWTSPDLPDPEFLELIKLFPSFVSRRPLARFPNPSNSLHPDLEEGLDDEVAEGKQIHFGTGSMWVSSKQRTVGWEGGLWTRFLLWWRRILC